MELNYMEVVTELKRRFPEGTVKFRTDNGRPYIPNQVYTDRLESAASSRWDLEIKDLEINAPFKYVKAIVRIRIESHYRDGYGFSPIDGDPSTEPRKIATAVDHAVNEAFLTALDTYEMGWKDLAPYKQNDWAGNTALKHLMEGAPPPVPEGEGVPHVHSHIKVSQTCVNCGTKLSEAEWELLKQIPKLNLIYCFEHLPKHWRRELPEKVLSEFEEKWAIRRQ
jgi:hypothetical protein